MTRGSLMVKIQRDDGFDFPSVLSWGVGYGKPQRDRSFEVSSTMGRYIEMHLIQEHEGW